MDIDDAYAAGDHAFRENDDYARAKYDMTLRWLAARNTPHTAVIYNIGCGNGLFNEIAAGAGYVVRAFEPDVESFEIAAARRPKGCTVEQLGLFEISGEDVADVIVMHDVLEHIGDDKKSVEHLHTLLKADGVLILSVPAMQSLFGLHDEKLGHFRRYSKRQLRDLFAPRFEVETVRYFGMSFVPITAWYSRFRRKPYPVAKASGRSLVAGAFRMLCRIESRVPAPIGTSLVLRASPNQVEQA